MYILQKEQAILMTPKTKQRTQIKYMYQVKINVIIKNTYWGIVLYDFIKTELIFTPNIVNIIFCYQSFLYRNY